jgi:hypothetical protein
MNVTGVLNTKAGMIGAGVLVVGALIYFFGKRAAAVVTDAVDAIGKVNEGTPYEGAGVVGTLGNLTNQISGGSLQSFGEWIGGKAYELFNKPYDPNVPNTPQLRRAATAASPVRPQDMPSAFLKVK